MKERGKVETDLQVQRVVNVTLDSDLYIDPQLLPNQQTENDDIMKSADTQEQRDLESQKWMARYNAKVFEGKVFRLKQNLNLALTDMLTTQGKIQDFHSSMEKAIEDVEDDLIVLDNLRRLNESMKGKKR